MSQEIFAINEFPNDGRLWRVVMFGGVSRSPKVPSEPVINALLASVSETCQDPFSREAMYGFDVCQVPVGIGQLPYISIGSTWLDRRPALVSSRILRPFKKSIDTTLASFVSIGDLPSIIPRSFYAFGGNWTHVAKTQMVAIEVDGDPYSILIPVSELIRFYYASSTRLTQALFWGIYEQMINPEGTGRVSDDRYQVQIRKFIPDSDAWTLARFHASETMQFEVSRLYKGLQKYSADAMTAFPPMFQGYQCGFPFLGTTAIEGLHIPLPGGTANSRRSLVLKLTRCSAPFPFEDLVCIRDNRNFQGLNAEDGDLREAWRKKIEREDQADEKDKQDDNTFISDSEPQKGRAPLLVDIREDRFAPLDGKKLIKNPTEIQQYRNAGQNSPTETSLTGFGTGEGVWDGATHKPAQVVVDKTEVTQDDSLPASLETFFSAMTALSKNQAYQVRFVASVDAQLTLIGAPCTTGFPTNVGTGLRQKANKWVKPTILGKRIRQVAIARVRKDSRTCYVLETERFKDTENLAVLVIANRSFDDLSADQIRSLLFDTAAKKRWPSPEDMAEYRRGTTTHRSIKTVEVLQRRIEGKVLEVLGLGLPDSQQPNKSSTDLGTQRVQPSEASTGIATMEPEVSN